MLQILMVCTSLLKCNDTNSLITRTEALIFMVQAVLVLSQKNIFTPNFYFRDPNQNWYANDTLILRFLFLLKGF